MNVLVVGLGLIGGSICKTIKKHTDYYCYGYDISNSVLEQAILDGTIDEVATTTDISDIDFTVVALHSKETIQFINENGANFKKGSIVIDTCGVKKAIIEGVEKTAEKYGFTFIGCHPMAGREFSGYTYSLDNLFNNASFLITPTDSTPADKLEQVKLFSKSLHFKKTVISTPEEHDRIIAFTSQLAHIVSNAYIKSPTLEKENGFSAGSFLDLTRVALLNPHLWTDLFLMNKDAILFEVTNIISNLNQYKNALEKEDYNGLYALLKDGSERKKHHNENMTI